MSTARSAVVLDHPTRRRQTTKDNVVLLTKGFDLPQLSRLEWTYMACRAWRHAWDEAKMTRRQLEGFERSSKFGDVEGVVCLRCTSERYCVVHWLSGERLTPFQYEHVIGYSAVTGYSMSQARALLARRRAKKRQGYAR